MPRIVPIKFREAGKQYDFNAQGFALDPGERVIVETDRGRALGTVVLAPREIPAEQAPADLKNVLRPASEEDLAMAASNAAREEEAFRFCLQRIQDRKMEMKLVRAEYLFDGSKIIFYFTADGRVDFRELVKDLAHHFHTRIEMRQIGVRDEAKLTGGIGICGRELCCCTFLTEFAPVSVKMAKEQGLALNPNKISGQCGRLLCCLGYEFETYCALRKKLPKCGHRVLLQNREVEVIEQDILAQRLKVRSQDGQTMNVTLEELEKGEPAPPGKPSQAAQPSRRKPQPAEGRKSKAKPPRPPREEKGATPPKPAAQSDQKPAPAAGQPQGEQAKPARKRNRRRRPRRN